MDITLKRREALYYYPAYFAIIALMFIGILCSNENGALEMNFLLNLNVLSFISYGEMRSHNTRGRRRMEFFNMWAFMILSYLIMSMTTFNLDPHQIIFCGNLFIGALICFIVINFAFFTANTKDDYIH